MRFGTVSHVLLGALFMGACTGHEQRDLDTQGELSELGEDDGGLPGDLTIAQRVVGHYAMRRRVAGHAFALGMEQKSMATTLGLVDIYEQDGKLHWSERNCRLVFENEPSSTKITLPDSVARTSPSLESEVKVWLEGDAVRWARPEAFLASGFHDQDPSLALPTNASDVRVYDQEGDGHPGITSHVKLRVLLSNIEGDIYYVERNRSEYTGTLVGERLVGDAIQESESNVLDATHLFLRIPLKAEQDLSREHSVVLAPLAQEFSCDDLVGQSDSIFR